MNFGKWLNTKTLIFIAVAYAGYWLGGMLLDYLVPFAPSIFTGIVGDVLRFAIPTTVVWIGWVQFGKGK